MMRLRTKMVEVELECLRVQDALAKRTLGLPVQQLAAATLELIGLIRRDYSQVLDENLPNEDCDEEAPEEPNKMTGEDFRRCQRRGKADSSNQKLKETIRRRMAEDTAEDEMEEGPMHEVPGMTFRAKINGAYRAVQVVDVVGHLLKVRLSEGSGEVPIHVLTMGSFHANDLPRLQAMMAAHPGGQVVVEFDSQTGAPVVDGRKVK